MPRFLPLLLLLACAAPLRAQTPAPAHPLAPRTFFPEGVAHATWAAPGGRVAHGLFVGSVRYGRIDRIDEATGAQTPFAAVPGRWGVFGLAADPARDALWAAIASVPYARARTDTTRASGLVRYSLRTGRRTGLWTLPGTALGDVAVDPRGTPYASDGASGALYRLGPRGLVPVPLAAPMRSAQGLAFTETGALYVADYATGVARLDLATGVRTPLALPDSITLRGTDGLAYADGQLFAIVNGQPVAHVWRMTLAPDGLGIAFAKRIARADRTPGMVEPTLGTVADGTFVFVGGTAWPAAHPDGRLALERLPAPALWRVLLYE